MTRARDALVDILGRAACGALLWSCALHAVATENATMPGTAVPAAPPDNPLRARVALAYDPVTRCPELRQADIDDPQSALVVLQIGPTGVPSTPMVRTSSGAQDLDAAALKCVMHLRFRPATALGSGDPISSWQQIAWKWSPRMAQAAAASPAAAGAVPAAAAGGATLAGTAAVAGSTAAPAQAVPGRGSVSVRVCVDDSGHLVQEPKIVHSSGDAGFDAAALEIARAGSGRYRVSSTSGGASTAGCEQLTIRSDGK